MTRLRFLAWMTLAVSLTIHTVVSMRISDYSDTEEVVSMSATKPPAASLAPYSKVSAPKSVPPASDSSQKSRVRPPMLKRVGRVDATNFPTFTFKETAQSPTSGTATAEVKPKDTAKAISKPRAMLYHVFYVYKRLIKRYFGSGKELKLQNVKREQADFHDMVKLYTLNQLAHFAINPLKNYPEATKNWTQSMVFDEHGLRGYIARIKGQKRIVAAFDGMKSLFEAPIGADMKLVPHDEAINAGYPDAKVHQGFWKRYASIRPRLLNALVFMFEQEHGSLQDWKFYVSGNSMGGALAQLFASSITARFKGLSKGAIQVTTTGAPRVGNPEWVRYMISAGSGAMKHHRIVHGNDAIPHLVPLGAFVHWEYEIIQPLSVNEFLTKPAEAQSANNVGEDANGTIDYKSHLSFMAHRMVQFKEWLPLYLKRAKQSPQVLARNVEMCSAVMDKATLTFMGRVGHAFQLGDLFAFNDYVEA